MIRGKYELHEGVWCLNVNGKVRPGDTVAVARPNGTEHRHKVEDVIMVAKGRRLCTIVPVTRDRVEEVYGILPHAAVQESARLR